MNILSFCLTNCISDQKSISGHFGPWPICWTRRDFRFWGVIFSIWIKIDQVMSILILSYELHFSENREIGSNQSDLRIRQSSQYHSTIMSQNRFHANTSLPLYLPLYFFIYQWFLYATLIPTSQIKHIYLISLPHKIQTILIISFQSSTKGSFCVSPFWMSSDRINLPRLVRTSQNRLVRNHSMLSKSLSCNQTKTSWWRCKKFGLMDTN